MKVLETIVHVIGISIMIALIAISANWKDKEKKDPREYQIQLDDDSVYIYDGDRLVGVLSFENSKLDSIFIKDNQ